MRHERIICNLWLKINLWPKFVDVNYHCCDHDISLDKVSTAYSGVTKLCAHVSTPDAEYFV